MSESTRPYKSRLFNLINRQSLKLKDKRDRAFRQLKVATEWGAQILLYPVYLVVQGTRMAGRQLQQTVQQKKLELQASAAKAVDTESIPTIDSPIQNVLQAVDLELINSETPLALIPTPQPALLKSPQATETLPNKDLPQDVVSQGIEELETASEEENSIIVQEVASLKLTSPEATDVTHPNNSSQDIVSQGVEGLETANQAENRIIVQGVASLIETKALVLVTRDNEILNILDSSQQKRLQQRITWEVANYNRHQQLTQKTQTPITGQLPIHTNDNPHILKPVRWFWNVMTWVQTSQVAIAANLFGESTLIQNNTPTPTFSLIPNNFSFRLADAGTITRIDATVAEIETQPIETAKKYALVLRNYAISLRQNETVPNSLSHSHTSQDLETPSPDPHSIQALIHAAIEYFFNKNHPSVSPAENVSPSLSETPSPPLLQRLKQRLFLKQSPVSPSLPSSPSSPWLSWEDLYGEKETPVPPRQKSPQSLPSSPPIPTSPSFTSFEAIENYLQRQKQTKAIQRKQRKTRKIQKTVSSPNQVTTTSATPNSVTPTKQEIVNIVASTPVSEDNIPQHTPDWLETPATPVGYVKHPLEQILEWLDRAMLWLEERLVSVWRSLFGK